MRSQLANHVVAQTFGPAEQRRQCAHGSFVHRGFGHDPVGPTEKLLEHPLCMPKDSAKKEPEHRDPDRNSNTDRAPTRAELAAVKPQQRLGLPKRHGKETPCLCRCPSEITRPSCSRQSRVVASATCGSCVTSTIVSPSRFTPIQRNDLLAGDVPRLPVGSSHSSTSGRNKRLRAIALLLLSPDSSVGTARHFFDQTDPLQRRLGLLFRWPAAADQRQTHWAKARCSG